MSRLPSAPPSPVFPAGLSEDDVLLTRPILLPPLAQDAAIRQPVAVDGPPFDSLAGCPSLSAAEEAKVKALKRAARLEVEPEAERHRAIYVEEAAAAIATERGIHPATARRMVEARFRGELFGSDTLVFDDPSIGTVSVADVMAAPHRFDDLTLADPLEGPSYGKKKAKVFVHGNNRRSSTPSRTAAASIISGSMCAPLRSACARPADTLWTLWSRTSSPRR